eukprot:gene28158-31258_t
MCSDGLRGELEATEPAGRTGRPGPGLGSATVPSSSLDPISPPSVFTEGIGSEETAALRRRE